jgi:hypothetical protein
MPRHRQRRAAPEPARPHRIELHVTEEEYADLRERAGRYTHGNVAAYLREAGLHRRMDPLPPPPPEINRDAYMSFLRVGALLNQAMHHLNAGNIWNTPQQLAALQQQLTELTALAGEIRRLLARST